MPPRSRTWGHATVTLEASADATSIVRTGSGDRLSSVPAAKLVCAPRARVKSTAKSVAMDGTRGVGMVCVVARAGRHPLPLLGSLRPRRTREPSWNADFLGSMSLERGRSYDGEPGEPDRGPGDEEPPVRGGGDPPFGLVRPLALRAGTSIVSATAAVVPPDISRGSAGSDKGSGDPVRRRAG